MLGSGLSAVAEAIESATRFSTESIPHFPRPAALGHRGELIAGRLSGVPVIVFSGRCHFYEGHAREQVTLPIRVAAALGVSRLILSNASGGLDPSLRLGELVVIDDHLDLQGRPGVRRELPALVETGHVPSGSCPTGGAGLDSPNSPRVPPLTAAGRRSPYDHELGGRALVMARREGIACRRGVYAAVTGPNYETRAEIRMLRRMGADVVGMSTVPEATLARELGLRTLGLSVVTNVIRLGLCEPVDPLDVVRVANAAGDRFLAIVRGVL